MNNLEIDLNGTGNLWVLQLIYLLLSFNPFALECQVKNPAPVCFSMYLLDINLLLQLIIVAAIVRII